MRANHIPLKVRLQNRMDKMQARLDAEIFRKVRGSFYEKCIHCGRDIISVNMYGHFSTCRVKSWEGELAYYKAMLEAL
jgi:hypothetical protein